MSRAEHDVVEESQPAFYVWAAKRLVRDPGTMVGLIMLALLVLAAVFAPQLAPNDPYRLDPPNRLSSPGEVPEYRLGTDEGGRCILSRLLYGGRLSLRAGLISTAIGVSLGTTIGVLGGFYNSLDNILLRIVDIMMAIPGILLALAIVSILGPGLTNVMIAVGIRITPAFARVTRSQVISLKEQTYVESARAAGARDLRIIWRHVLVNFVSVLIVFSTLYMASALMSVSVLSFLGFGVRAPAAEWGMMASSGRNYFLEAPHVIAVPSLAIMAAILSLNLVGDALRDILDPRLRQ